MVKHLLFKLWIWSGHWKGEDHLCNKDELQILYFDLKFQSVENRLVDLKFYRAVYTLWTCVMKSEIWGNKISKFYKYVP